MKELTQNLLDNTTTNDSITEVENHLVETLEDIELKQIIMERENSPEIEVDIEEL